ncbi:glycoside hydrolase family 71 protein [Irpex rosettiformis]|uniref:Glycoside hydrolase family 71 protein n=1 Tax=Irpex rosettiformis TaxID=378272 RepID=A0ACB8TSF8_9APHY|nr:glycoside hydrolase family 71 protein [Irpex rosettiformis]
MDDAQLVSKADAVSAINQSLTPVGTFPTTLQPALPVNKLVFAHFIVGNTYNYSTTNWKADIILASSKGIDAFALNVGSDSWEPSQVANAFFAASALKTSFKLFLSFDMGSLPCARATDADLLKTYISTYKTHPNQQLIDGKVLVSTFSGSDCKFEQNTVDNGWKYAIKSGANANGTYFVPAWFIDPATFSQYTVLDGAFGWNSGWPMGDYDIDFSQDQAYINNLPSRSYMAAVSPWFYTHYQSKNFIYRSDDWLLAKRWEDLITHRSSVNFVEVNTWNDYGESHYVGPIEGIQPNSQAWVDGYDHTAWLDLIKYYISAFKTGTYPTISTDRTFVWGRTYKANAVATNDPLPKPDHYTWTDDYIYAVILLRTPATFTLSCGSLTTTSAAPAGLSKFKLGPLIQSCTVSSKITRGRTVVNNTYQSKFKFTTANPSVYNYNAYVAST